MRSAGGECTSGAFRVRRVRVLFHEKRRQRSRACEDTQQGTAADGPVSPCQRGRTTGLVVAAGSSLRTPMGVAPPFLA
eukprot:13183030-Alexandrium_andersonii.AAC.1